MTEPTLQLDREPIAGLALLSENLRPADDAARDIDFTQALARATSNTDPKDETREAAEQLVAITFIQPMLRAAREANNAAPPFAPTAIEKQFGPLMDARLSDAIMRASRWPLIDRIERDMRANGDTRPTEIADRLTPTAPETPNLQITGGTNP